MTQHITVTEYDPKWPLLYDKEREKLIGVLKGNCLAMYHIGSTSVPGLAAKPIIDIMAAVKSLEGADAAAAEFSRLGYEYCGEFGIKGRRYLRIPEKPRRRRPRMRGGHGKGHIARGYRPHLR